MIHWHNLKYILRHKWLVFQECCKLGIPWLGIVHDWSKFLPDEWIAYARFFYGARLSNRESVTKRDGSVQSAFDLAWLRHQHRNKHHWQHWILINDVEPTKFLQIPERYLREMVADWRGASAARGGDAIDWWHQHGHQVMMHENSLERFKELLGV